MSSVMSFIEGLMDSVAIYPVLFGISFVDALIPMIPSELPIIMAGVYAATTGQPFAPLAMLAAASGAVFGDHVTYFLGRQFSKKIERVPVDSCRGKVFASTCTLLDRHGPTILIVARFIPWGRIAVNLLLGVMRMSLRSYTPYDVIGVLIWVVYGVTVGYLGGRVFEHNPLAGVLLGLTVALLITVIIEGVRELLWLRKSKKDSVIKPATDVTESSVTTKTKQRAAL